MEEEFDNYLELINNCDPLVPLLSRTRLGDCINKLALKFVEPSELKDLYQALNVKQLITTENGLARDYRGLAELMGYSSIEIDGFDRCQNPTRNLVESYILKREEESEGMFVSLNDLIKLIEQIERFDIIDDLLATLVKLANKIVKEQKQVRVCPGQLVAYGRQGAGADSVNDMRIAQYNQAENLLKPLDQLTIDDTSQIVTLYDAFICHAPDDIDYAEQLISILQSRDVRCVTADFLLPGQFEYDALIRCIELRCRKVIIILTENFSRSKECEFQTKFASEFAIRNSPGLSGTPRIIPILYEPCDDSTFPSIIKVMSKIDMTHMASRQWQVEKLIRALRMD